MPLLVVAMSTGLGNRERSKESTVDISLGIPVPCMTISSMSKGKSEGFLDILNKLLLYC